MLALSWNSMALVNRRNNPLIISLSANGNSSIYSIYASNKSHKSHDASDPNPKMHQNVALWDMGLEHCGIRNLFYCMAGLLRVNELHAFILTHSDATWRQYSWLSFNLGNSVSHPRRMTCTNVDLFSGVPWFTHFRDISWFKRDYDIDKYLHPRFFVGCDSSMP